MKRKKTWLYLDEDVYNEAKEVIRDQGYFVMRKMGEILENGLKVYIEHSPKRRKRGQE